MYYFIVESPIWNFIFEYFPIYIREIPKQIEVVSIRPCSINFFSFSIDKDNFLLYNCLNNGELSWILQLTLQC